MQHRLPLDRVVVNAVRLDGGAPRTTVTDGHGRYSFNAMPAGGSYAVTPQPIERPGHSVPPGVTSVNLSRDRTAAFYRRPVMPSTCEPPTEYLSDRARVTGYGKCLGALALGHAPERLD